ncbi:hypothetical protein H8959_019238 [Pygathrix nigripes]
MSSPEMSQDPSVVTTATGNLCGRQCLSLNLLAPAGLFLPTWTGRLHSAHAPNPDPTPAKSKPVFFQIQLSCYISSGSCEKVLVWPTEFSHWMNIKTILDELLQRGHEVTLLASSASILFDPNSPSTLKLEAYPVSLTKTEFKDIIMQLVKRWSDLPKDTFWSYFSQVQEITWTFNDIIRKFCKDVISNKKLTKKLQESKFDVVFADAIVPCGELLAELFNVPFVYSLCLSAGYTIEKHSGGFLFPPSYVPVVVRTK